MSDKQSVRWLPFPLRISTSALLLALICMLLNPLSALACGGLFSKDIHTEQSGERLIYAVDPGKVTLYEQFTYTGAPKDFVWVLPVPAIPTLDLASVGLFRELDRDTTPMFYMSQHTSSGCFPDNGSNMAGAPAPISSSSVHVYNSGGIGPYSYDVIGSHDPHALTQWLNGHQYKLSTADQAELQSYVSAKMLFLVMRLQGQAKVQDIAPVKITYASSQSTISIPLRLAAPMGKTPLGVTIWIFGNSRYIPQNYQSVVFTNNDFSSINNAGSNFYTEKVDQAISRAQGHAFVTEYAQPTQHMYAEDAQLQTLQQRYSYLTRLYTRISANQLQRDPAFVAQQGLSDISRLHSISSPAEEPQNCTTQYMMIGGVFLLGMLVIGVPIVLFVRRRRTRLQ